MNKVKFLILLACCSCSFSSGLMAEQVKLGSSVEQLKAMQAVPAVVPMPEHAPVFSGKRAQLTVEANYQSKVSEKAETKTGTSFTNDE